MTTTTPSLPYATPPAPARPHSRVGTIAFALGAFATGAMLLSVLAVAFPLMNASPAWETPAAIFGFTMFGAWVLSGLLALVGLFQRNTSRLYPGLTLLMSVATLFLAVIFLGVA